MSQYSNFNQALIWLRDNIEDHSNAMGQIPAQRHLAKLASCSLGTLRKALQILEEEGLIVTHHGLGTFLKSSQNKIIKPTLPSLNDMTFPVDEEEPFIAVFLPINIDKANNRTPMSYLHLQVCSGILEEAKKQGYRIVIKLHEPYKELEEKSLTEFEIILQHKNCRGLILASIVNEKIQQRIFKFGKPGIIIDHWAADKVQWDSIQSNTTHAVKEIVSILANLGHENIALIDREKNELNPHVLEGYKDAFKQLGKKFRPSLVKHVSLKHGTIKKRITEIYNYWAQCNNKPSALVTFSPLVAHTMKNYLESTGLDIPNEFSIATINPLSKGIKGKKLAGVATDWKMGGQWAVQKLLERLKNSRKKKENLFLASIFNLGETVAPFYVQEEKISL
ncbi:MAG: hypothetical protein COA79_26595 [Planctomycetota bacterium]|nr:MAG: hypothetical protein COA79_26595 [Planctomycetota bacterium]